METKPMPELAAAMAEARLLRELVREICDSIEAVSDRAGMGACIVVWRKRAGLPH